MTDKDYEFYKNNLPDAIEALVTNEEDGEFKIEETDIIHDVDWTK